MAVSRLTQTTLQNGFEKFNRIWDERSAVGSMEAISAITLSAAQSSVEFNNIPGTYSHLQIRGIAKSSGAGNEDLMVRLNGDTGSNYTRHALFTQGSTASAQADSSQTAARIADNFVVESSSSNIYGGFILDILDFTNTNKYKTLRTLFGADRNGAGVVGFHSNLWMNSQAITSILIYPAGNNFAANSSFTLYGIK